MNRYRLAVIIVAALQCLPAMTALGLPDDRDQPVDFSGATGDFLIAENRMIYKGSEGNPVTASQGSLQISGLHLEATGSREETVHLFVTGAPARFQVQPRADADIVYGNGERITYEESNDSILLEVNARMESKGRIINAARIDYHAGEQRLTASAANEQTLVSIELATSDGLLFGKAMQAIYDEAAGQVTLEGLACLQMDKVVFRGHLASYDLNTSRGSARGRNETDRINVTDQGDSCR